MKYIESLREGERINEIYLCKVKQSALTKAGKPYDSLTLQDKTGTLEVGKLADILVVKGNPLENIELFKNHQKNLLVIMQGGRMHKNILA